MSRLSPTIVRRLDPPSLAGPLEQRRPLDGARSGAWLEDLKLFATGWIGGLIFFGTLLS